MNEAVCFLLISVSYTIGWSAISSMLANFKELYGPGILLSLNLAYFLPSIPVLGLQTLFDERINQRFGLATATAWRFVLGLGGSVLITAVFPLLPETRSLLIQTTILLGILCGIAFGSSYQLVAYFPVSSTVALTVGFVASAPLILLVEAADRIGPSATANQKLLLFELTALVTLAGLVGSIVLLRRNWTFLNTVQKAASPYAALDQEEDLLDREAGGGDVGQLPEALHSGMHDRREHPPVSAFVPASRTASDSSSSPSEGTITVGRAGSLPLGLRLALLARINHEASVVAPHTRERRQAAEVSGKPMWQSLWQPSLSLAVSAGTSTLLFPFFLYVPSSGRLGMGLPQVLFAARVAADIVGRVLPPHWFGLDYAGLLSLSAFKLALTPLAFWYIGADWHNDFVAVTFVAFYWLQSGLCNTAAFLLSQAKMGPSGQSAQAGSFLTLVFQVSCLVALLIALLIQMWNPEFSR